MLSRISTWLTFWSIRRLFEGTTKSVYCLTHPEFGEGWQLVANQASSGSWMNVNVGFSPTGTHGSYSSSWNHESSYYASFTDTGFSEVLLLSGNQEYGCSLSYDKLVAVASGVSTPNLKVLTSFGVGVAAGAQTNVLGGASPEFPWVGCEGTYSQNQARMLWGEGASTSFTAFKNANQGVGMFVRDPGYDSCDAVTAAGLPSGPYRIGHGASSRRVYCETQIFGGGWTLVGNQKNHGFFDYDTNLRPDVKFGDYSATWRHDTSYYGGYVGLPHEQALFMTGNGQHACVLPLAMVLAAGGDHSVRTVPLAASKGVGKLTARSKVNVVNNRPGVPEDPWVNCDGDHWASNRAMMWGDGFTGGVSPWADHKNANNGVGFFVRTPTTYASCVEVTERGLPTGTYTLRLQDHSLVSVYCDTTSFSGGWTLVANQASSGGWMPADTNLDPRSSYGSYSPSWEHASHYYMPFEHLPHDQVMFQTGDGAVACVMRLTEMLIWNNNVHLPNVEIQHGRGIGLSEGVTKQWGSSIFVTGSSSEPSVGCGGSFAQSSGKVVWMDGSTTASAELKNSRNGIGMFVRTLPGAQSVGGLAVAIISEPALGSGPNHLPPRQAGQVVIAGLYGQFPEMNIIQGAMNHDRFYTQLDMALEVKQPGAYTFRSYTDDGVFVFVDSIRIINDGTYHGMAHKYGTIYLAAGTHAVDAYMFENGGGAGFVFHYSGPDTGNSYILLKHTHNPTCATNFNFAWHRSTNIDSIVNVPAAGSTTTTFWASWLPSSLSRLASLPATTITVRVWGPWLVKTAGQYFLELFSDDQGRVYVDGALVVHVTSCCRTVTTTLTLSAGVHSFEQRVNQGGGPGYAQLRVRGPDTGGRLIHFDCARAGDAYFPVVTVAASRTAVAASTASPASVTLTATARTQDSGAIGSFTWSLAQGPPSAPVTFVHPITGTALREPATTTLPSVVVRLRAPGDHVFRVIVTRGDGRSESTTAQAPTIRVGGAAQELRSVQPLLLREQLGTDLSVQWAEVDSSPTAGAAVLGYLVDIKLLEGALVTDTAAAQAAAAAAPSEAASLYTRTLTPSASYQFSGLGRKSVYIVRVAVATETAVGPWAAAPFPMVNGGVPGPFTLHLSRTGPDYVSLWWEAPAEDGGEPLATYEFSVLNRDSGDSSSYVVRHIPGQLNLTLSRLQGLTRLSIIGRASNQASCLGPGRPSNRLNVTTTLPSGPSKPLLSQQTGSTGTCVTVAWMPPSSFGGLPLSGYKLFLQEPSPATAFALASDQRGSTRTSATLCSLPHASTLYTLRVVGVSFSAAGDNMVALPTGGWAQLNATPAWGVPGGAVAGDGATLELWLRLSSAPAAAQQATVLRWAAADGADALSLSLIGTASGAPQLRWSAAVAAGAGQTVDSIATIAVGSWSHIAVVITHPTTVSLVVDGWQDAVSTSVNTPRHLLRPDLTLGASSPTDPSPALDAALDELRLWSTPLPLNTLRIQLAPPLPTPWANHTASHGLVLACHFDHTHDTTDAATAASNAADADRAASPCYPASVTASGHNTGAHPWLQPSSRADGDPTELVVQTGAPDPPDAPPALTLTLSQGGMLTFDVPPPANSGGVPLTMFTVDVALPANASRGCAQLAPGSRPFATAAVSRTVRVIQSAADTPLLTTTQYCVSARVGNRVGYSPPTATALVATDTAQSLPGTPTPPAAGAASESSLTFTLIPPPNAGGAPLPSLQLLLRVTLDVNGTEGAQVHLSNHSHAHWADSVVVDGLAADTRYRAYVAAENPGAGRGNWSLPTVVATRQSDLAWSTANPSLKCVSAHWLHALWTAPGGLAGGATYTLRLSSAGQPDSTPLVDGEGSSFRVSSLSPATPYTLSLRYYDILAKVTSQYSTPTAVTTGSDPNHTLCMVGDVAALGHPVADVYEYASPEAAAAAVYSGPGQTSWELRPPLPYLGIALTFSLLSLECDHDTLTVAYQDGSGTVWAATCDRTSGDSPPLVLSASPNKPLRVTLTRDGSVHRGGVRFSYAAVGVLDTPPAPLLPCGRVDSGSAECSGHGTCDTASGACACDSGYSGDGCSAQVFCPGHAACDSLSTTLLVSPSGLPLGEATGHPGNPVAGPTGAASKAFDSVAPALAAAGHGSTVLLMPGTYRCNLTLSLPPGTHVLLSSLRGSARTTLDCGGTGFGLRVSGGGSLTVRGLAIADAASALGGAAIRATGGTSLTLDDVVIAGARSDGDGGAVFVGDGGGGGSAGTLNATGLVTRDSRSGGRGGSVWCEGSATLLSLSITGATATGDRGGCIAVGGDAVLSTANLSSCAALAAPASAGQGGGGALFCGAACTLSHLSVATATAPGDGGAVAATGAAAFADVTVTDASSTAGNGGALSLRADAQLSTLTIQGSSSSGNGGAVACAAACNFAHTTIHTTTASSGDGGAVFCAGAGDFNAVTVTAATASGAGGAVACSDRCSFTAFHARSTVATAGAGGAIHCAATSASCTLSAVTVATASSGAQGGAVACAGRCDLAGLNSTATSSGGDGGAVACAGDCTLTAVAVHDSSASGAGGALACGAAAHCTITSFTGRALRASGGDGGAISCGATCTLSAIAIATATSSAAGGAVACAGNCTMEDVNATATNSGGDGGAIACGAACTLSRANLRTSTSGGDGGAVACTGACDFTDVSVAAANAGGAGGGVSCGDRCTFSGVAFDSCAGAGAGGAVLCRQHCSLSTVTLSHCRSTAGSGGGLACLSSCTLAHVNASGCTAGGGGGGGAVSCAGSCDVSHSVLSGCTATAASGGHGGGLFCGGGCDVRDTTFSHNTAHAGAGLGGALAVGGAASLSLTRALLLRNSAASGGGLHCAAAAPCQLLSVNATANLATGVDHASGFGVGGAVALAGSGSGSSSGSSSSASYLHVVGNTATNSGGGVYAAARTLSLTHAWLRDNIAVAGNGGALAADSTTLNLTSVALAGNSAGRFGGGIRMAGGSAVYASAATLSGNAASVAGGALSLSDSSWAAADAAPGSGDDGGTAAAATSPPATTIAAAAHSAPFVTPAGVPSLHSPRMTVMSGNHGVSGAVGGCVHGERTWQLSHATLVGCTASSGGALFASGGSHGRLVDCVLTSCSATAETLSPHASAAATPAAAAGGSTPVAALQAGWGGGLLLSPTAVLNASRVNISGNAAQHGGGVATVGAALSLLHSSLSRNAATSGHGGGGAATAHSQWHLTHTTVTHNTASSGAGASLQHSTAQLASVDLSFNVAALSGGGLRLQASAVTASTASAAAGAGSSSSSSSMVSVPQWPLSAERQQLATAFAGPFPSTLSARLHLNSVTSLSGTGGAVVVVPPATTTTSTASAAPVQPSALTGLLLSRCTARSGGGVFLEATASLTLSSSVLAGNSAALEGGGLYVSSQASATLSSLLVVDNTALDGGGAVALQRASLTATATALLGNSATATGAQGGAVLSQSSTTAFSSSTLSHNSAAAGDGGAVFVSAGTLSLTHSTLTHNTASVRGGGVVAEQGTAVTLAHFTAAHNHARSEGGSLLFSAASLNATHTQLSHSTAFVGGGLYLAPDAHAQLSHSSIRDCAVGGLGGAVALLRGASLTALHSTLQRNAAMEGGGAISGADATVTLRHSTLLSNAAAAGPGGALLFTRASSLALHSCTLRGNLATGEGGAATLRARSHCTMEDCTLESNAADSRGGAASVSGTAALSLQRCTLHRNLAPLGGAVHTSGASTVTADGSHFSSNVGVQRGGALVATSVLSGSVTLSHCTFHGNAASRTGGALQVPVTATLSLAHSTFTSNLAVSGGGVFWGTAAGDASVGAGTSLLSAVNLSAAAGGNASTLLHAAVSASGDDGSAAAASTTVAVDGAALAASVLPLSTLGCTFSGNRGGGIASEAVRLIIGWFPTTPLQSGQPLEATDAEARAGALLTHSAAPERHPFALAVDHYGAVSAVQNSASCSLQRAPSEQRAVVVSNPTAHAASGVLRFSGLLLRAPPGESLGMQLSCVMGSARYTLPLPLTVGPCKPAYEPGLDQTCIDCVSDRYSPQGDKCLDCPLGGYCRTVVLTDTGFKRQLGVAWPVARLNFWRFDVNKSTFFLPCKYAGACLGFPHPLEQCAEGYTGNLCNKCAEGWGLSKLTEGCSRCLGGALSKLYLLAAISIMGVMIAGLVSTTLTDVGHVSTEDCAVRIFMSYLQVVAMSANFDLRWPPPVRAMFVAQELLTTLAEKFMQIDCEVSDSEELPKFYQKQLFFGAVPLLCIAVAALFWAGRAQLDRMRQRRQKAEARGRQAAARAVKDKDSSKAEGAGAKKRKGGGGSKDVIVAEELEAEAVDELGLPVVERPPEEVSPMPSKQQLPLHSTAAHKQRLTKLHVAVHGLAASNVIFKSARGNWDNFVTSCVVLLYMVYPQLVRRLFTMISCTQLAVGDGGEKLLYLRAELDILCYSPGHTKWLLLVGLPCFVLYILGLPALSFIMLHKNRKTLDALDTHFRYGFLYSGFHHHFYYWEVIVTVRKTLLIWVSMFLIPYGTDIQTYVAIGILLASLVAHIEAQPYSNAELHALEKYALYANISTLWFGLVLFSDKIPTHIQYLFSISIIAVNLAFTAFAGRHLVHGLRSKLRGFAMRRTARKAAKGGGVMLMGGGGGGGGGARDTSKVTPEMLIEAERMQAATVEDGRAEKGGKQKGKVARTPSEKAAALAAMNKKGAGGKGKSKGGGPAHRQRGYTLAEQRAEMAVHQLEDSQWEAGGDGEGEHALHTFMLDEGEEARGSGRSGGGRGSRGSSGRSAKRKTKRPKDKKKGSKSKSKKRAPE